jgi:hypothetical protein
LHALRCRLFSGSPSLNFTISDPTFMKLKLREGAAKAAVRAVAWLPASHIEPDVRWSHLRANLRETRKLPAILCWLAAGLVVHGLGEP